MSFSRHIPRPCRIFRTWSAGGAWDRKSRRFCKAACRAASSIKRFSKRSSWPSRRLSDNVRKEHTMRGTDAVAEILKLEGTEYLFAYPNHPLIDAAARLGI